MIAQKNLSLLAYLFALTTHLFCADNENYRAFSSFTELSEYLSWAADKEPIISAHRGGPESGFPENALETFENALSYGPCLIEFDIRRSKDGVLFLMHDKTVDRTTNGSGLVSELSFAEIERLKLIDKEGTQTDFAVPTLAEALEWGKGRAILSLDVKNFEDFAAVIDQVRISEARGHVIIIVYSIQALVHVHALDPKLMISVSSRSKEDLERLAQSGVPFRNMVGFMGLREGSAELIRALKEEGIMSIQGTIGNLDRKALKVGPKVYVDILERGANIIATDYVREVAEAIREFQISKD